MTKLSLVTLLVIVCLQLLGCRQSRPPDTPVASHTQQAIVTPIPTYTPIAQSVTQQRNSQSVVPEADVSKASATPTAETVPVPTSPTATATATRQPTATATRQPTATPTPEYYVTGSANLRSGPGTNYDIVGGRQPNDVLSPIARTADGEWIQGDDNIWIWSGLVEGNIESLPVTSDLPVAPEPTATPLLIKQPQTPETTTPATSNEAALKPFCLSSDVSTYIISIFDMIDYQELMISRLADTNFGTEEFLTVVEQFDILHANALNLDPPREFLTFHKYFLENTMWLALAGNTFKLAFEWNQSHWVDVTFDRLKKSDEFAILSDSEFGNLFSNLCLY